MTYDKTRLWRSAFVDPRDDAPAEEQHYFRQLYIAMHEKAAALTSRIAADMDGLTVHDVSHLDALWEMASIVASETFELNPPEAFVFGGAALLHDAALTLAAYPNGLEDLKETLVWKDSHARLAMQAEESEDADDDPATLEYLATAEALRKLHASEAEQLPTRAWSDGTGDPEYLIDDPEVRNYYGPTIGQIAASHWWSVARFESDFYPDLGPLGGRTGHRLDRIKIACLLRVADAIHLDRRRAPAFLQKLVNPKGASKHHWLFQRRMGVPYVEDEALVYSAAPAFELEAAEAWWLAFEAVNMVDGELRAVDRLLQQEGKPRLQARGVKGAGPPTDLSRFIETSGWTPVDTQVRVSDVPKIVLMLGGKQLYGDDPKVALRELIQNARDAVEARRMLERRNDDWGMISVALERRDDHDWLIVEDTGVGMSQMVLTGPLIDFGNSFWKSQMVADEFPGLQAEGFSSVGRYGIGFFSVFMLGSRVRVTSRRYERGEDSIRTLEFRNGLNSPPILHKASLDKPLVDCCTRVEIRLDRAMDAAGRLLEIVEYWEGMSSFPNMISSIAPSCSVNIEVIEDGNNVALIKVNDWLKISGSDLLSRLYQRNIGEKKGKKSKATRLREVIDSDGRVYGRAMIVANTYGDKQLGCVTIGGLRSAELSVFQGVLLGEGHTVSRQDAIPSAPRQALSAWASEQAELIQNSQTISPSDKAIGAQVVLLFDGDIGNLPIAKQSGKWLSTSELGELLKSMESALFSFDYPVCYEGDTDDVSAIAFDNHFEEDSDIIFVPQSLLGFLGISWLKEKIWHPSENVELQDLQDIARECVMSVWGNCFDESQCSKEVGYVEGAYILRDVVMLSR